MSASVVDDDLAEAFARHGRELRVFCYRMTGSLTDADDLSQETFLRAWRSRDDFRRAASPRTWLYRIATNACLDHLARHERRTAPAGSVHEVLDLPDGRLASVQCCLGDRAFAAFGLPLTTSRSALG